jgi:hypothetical protein
VGSAELTSEVLDGAETQSLGRDEAFAVGLLGVAVGVAGMLLNTGVQVAGVATGLGLDALGFGVDVLSDVIPSNGGSGKTKQKPCEVLSFYLGLSLTMEEQIDRSNIT